MAKLNDPILKFDGGCPDCGERIAVLPIPIPGVANDFDWKSRDYDSFRLFMMQELAYRFPERKRWTPADIEVVIIEILSSALDRASHAIDTVQAERFLETARRPQSVRRLLKLIGYDAVERTDPNILDGLPPLPDQTITESKSQKLERYWRLEPSAMEQARKDGPRLTQEVRRMVTLNDHEIILQKHPLVARARARHIWSGAWYTILVAALLEGNKGLDNKLHIGVPPANNIPSNVDQDLWRQVIDYHRIENLALPPVNGELTARHILRVVIEQNRMIGSEVFLEGTKPLAISFDLSVRAKKGYFRSELKQALNQIFTSDKGGFFEPGQHGFGEDLFASDLIEKAMSVEGVEVACLNRFKRVGNYPDRTSAGVIEVAEDEFVLCDNERNQAENGTFRIIVNAGELS